MASKHEIEMNFEAAKRQADKLDNIADELDRLSKNRFNDTLQSVSAAWKGESATLYVNKGVKLQGDITQNAVDFRSIAQEIRAIAQRIYEAEMANYERAKRRDYG